MVPGPITVCRSYYHFWLRVRLHCFCSQYYQRLLHGLIRITVIWRDGDPSLANELTEEVHKVLGVLQALSHFVGAKLMTPKVHELLHIPIDYKGWGRAQNYTNGRYHAMYNGKWLKFGLSVISLDLMCVAPPLPLQTLHCGFFCRGQWTLPSKTKESS